MTKFPLTQDWEEAVAQQANLGLRRVSTQFRSSGSAELLMESMESGNARFMLSPSSGFRLMWVVLGMLLIGYDITVIPLVVFGVVDPDDVMRWLDRVILLYWSCDILCCFRTGYIDSMGQLVMSPRRVANQYATTWLPFDLLILGLDWIYLIALAVVGAAVHGEEIARFVRVARLLRAARTFKMIKQNFEVIWQRFGDERMLVLTGIIKIVVLIVLAAHYIACCWYYIGFSHEGEDNWVKWHGMASEGVSSVYVYATTLHWALILFTGGEGDVTPHNETERIFTIVALLFAFVLAACLVSIITTSMTRLHILAGRRAEEISILKHYLADNGVSSDLALRVRRSAAGAIKEREKNLLEDKVELLRLLSKPLRAELHTEIYSPILCNHPLFKCISEHHPRTMSSLCHLAVSIESLMPGDVLFSKGDVPTPPRMMFVRHGSLEYTHSSHASVIVGAGEYFAEPSLWVQWVHCGEMTVLEPCQLLVVDAQKFTEVMRSTRLANFRPDVYAALMRDALAEMKRRCLGDVAGDLPDPEPFVKTAFIDQGLGSTRRGSLSSNVSTFSP